MILIRIAYILKKKLLGKTTFCSCVLENVIKFEAIRIFLQLTIAIFVCYKICFIYVFCCSTSKVSQDSLH
jgi:hypothetical protein